MRSLRQIWLILTLNCEQSARLTSESLDRRLNWAERWAVTLHRLICSQSRRLDKQIILLDQALQEWTAGETSPRRADSLSSQAKQRIKQALLDRRPG